MNALSIHVTDLCNSTCSFCVVASPFYSTNTINYEDMEAFLRGNQGDGFDVVNLHGGEATIHPRFVELLKLIKELGYAEIHLQTNGIRLADREFASLTAASGVSKAIVSLHGHTSELQDRQTGTKGGMAKTIEGLRNLSELGVMLRTNTVITRQNLKELAAICELACKTGVDHINLSNLHPVGSALLSRSNVMPKLTAMMPYLREAHDTVRSYGRTFTLEGFPYCVVAELRGAQLNNEYRAIKMLMRGSIIEDYDSFMSKAMRTYGLPCLSCQERERCGGVYPQYVEYFGWGEFTPITAATERDV